MLNIPPQSTIIKDALTSWFEKPSVVTARCSEFDGFYLRLESESIEAVNVLHFHIKAQCLSLGYPQDLNLHAHLDQLFSPFFCPDCPRKDTNDICICLDHTKLPEDPSTRETLLSNLCSIRSIILGLPYQKALELLEEAKKTKSSSSALILDPIRIKISEFNHMFVYCDAQNLFVTFALSFKDSSDSVLVRPLLQELVDAKKGRSVASLPSVSWEEGVPAKLVGFANEYRALPSSGFITFTLFPSIWGKKESMINQMISFRSFLTLHLKAMNAAQHVQLRRRFTASLASFNKAKPAVV
ncbi:hypothetical protein RCL1_006153 [Eukaryota sp. TZLM3-RCL]